MEVSHIWILSKDLRHFYLHLVTLYVWPDIESWKLVLPGSGPEGGGTAPEAEEDKQQQFN